MAKKHCQLCPLTLNSKRLLDRHVNTVHLKIPDFECFKCYDKASDRFKRFLNDIQDIRKWNCFECDYSTSLLWCLSRHENVHAKSRRVPKKCTSKAAPRPRAKINVSSVIERKKSCLRRQLCGLCRDSLTTRRGLYQHLEEVHKLSVKIIDGEVSAVNDRKKLRLKRHLCGLCRDSLPTRHGLYKHLKEKHNFECEETKAQDDIDLNGNIKDEVEQETTTFTCGICYRSYLEEEDLLKHLREEDHDDIPNGADLERHILRQTW